LKATEGRPFATATISSVSNLSHSLEEYRRFRRNWPTRAEPSGRRSEALIHEERRVLVVTVQYPLVRDCEFAGVAAQFAYLWPREKKTGLSSAILHTVIVVMVHR